MRKIFLMGKTMLIYEVNLVVDSEIKEEFTEWLYDHINEMLKFDGFLSADLYEFDKDEINRISWCVHYHIENERALEEYLSKHAKVMRAKALELFPGYFTAKRRVLEPLSSYQKK